ncbi:hypothetical protein SAMN05444394_2981 [Algoriphagus halophilus]|uniref:Uncharacterized protein n=1 Tax=Algoriphagus halophilus TaxID=226505 RepID=A0A1N6G5N2_9BACT|nr:hypothetical protein SAMN05444394_2981 [Algoriphagus halophilus]
MIKILILKKHISERQNQKRVKTPREETTLGDVFKQEVLISFDFGPFL